MNTLCTFLFGTKAQRNELRLRRFAETVNEKEQWARSLTDKDFPLETEKLRSRLIHGEKPETVRSEAFALAREAARRVLGMRPFDVQVMGAYVLDSGCVAEMKTGEGKTLVCVLSAYFNSLTGSNVHIITVNEYLAQRDAEWMGPVYSFLGLKTGHIYTGMDHEERRTAYQCDVTYGTNSEFAFDYLRDNMQYSMSGKVQRGFSYAVVDEADSILIDEARTPLIISGEGGDDSSFCLETDVIAQQLTEAEKLPGTDRYPDELAGEKTRGDFTLDKKHRRASLTSEGMAHVEKLLQDRGLITGSLTEPINFYLVHYVMEALSARYLYKKDTDYVISGGQVLIVDEFTGRILSGRRYGEGLHEAIEAKEQIPVRRQTCTLASVSYQNYFRQYEKLSGMTGTAVTETEEFRMIYGMDVIEVPTNRPLIRTDLPTEIYRKESDKWLAVAAEVIKVHKTGEPVLIGTASVEKSEYLSRLLSAHGICHQVLNAKNNKKEAGIIAQAGAKGAVTISTNMAGRGTDIKLGGDPEAVPGAAEEIRVLGGLYVIGTECYESRRIDNQLRGRAGRQGDPGKSRFFISAEDPLFRIHGNVSCTTDITRLSPSAVQKKVESFNFTVRKELLDYDDVLNSLRADLYSQRDEILQCTDLQVRILADADDRIQHIIKEYEKRASSDTAAAAEFLTEALEALCGYRMDKKACSSGISCEILQNIHKTAAQKERSTGKEQLSTGLKALYLHLIDRSWSELLEELDTLRQGVHLRTYAQKRPIVEYQTDADRLFREMAESVRITMIKALCG